MHEVSDGERRRVQIVSGLMAPWDVLLLDEVRSSIFACVWFLLDAPLFFSMWVLSREILMQSDHKFTGDGRPGRVGPFPPARFPR